MNQWIPNRTMNNRWCEKQLDTRRKGDGERDRERASERARKRVRKEQNILTNYKLMGIGIGSGAETEVEVGKSKS